MVLTINKKTKKEDINKILKKASTKTKKEGFDAKKITKPVKSFVGIDSVKYQREIRDAE